MEKKPKTQNEALKGRVDQLAKEIALVQEHLKLTDEEIKNIRQEEEPGLLRWFWIVVIVLSLSILVTAYLTTNPSYLNLEMIWRCIWAGVFGSSTSALISALQRKANGWQFENGLKYPSDQPRDKFSKRMSTFFIFRPLLGFFGGLVVFYGLESIYVGADNFSENTLIFWSIITGLFAKSLIDKLKSLFDGLIGK